MEQPLTDAEAQLEQSMKDNYQSIWTDMLTAGTTGPEMCNYLDWAYYARVNLTGNMDTWIEIHNTVCKTYSDSVTQANIALEWSDDGLVSNAFNQKLLDTVKIGGTAITASLKVGTAPPTGQHCAVRPRP